MSVEAATALSQQESNTARKKRERAAQAAKSAGPGQAAPEQHHPAVESPAPTNDSTNGDHASSESPYVKELVKQVRNISKKLTASAKVDAIIAENSKSSLDELIAAKKINADQKAQILKKPQLQAQLAQLEEQLSQYRKVDSEYQSRLAAELESVKSKHESELKEVRQSGKAEAEANVKIVVRQKLLIFSQFLRTAAAKRAREDEVDTEESKAFEGALLLVYGGDDKAVEAAENIVEGADQVVPSTEGLPLSVKYSQIKTASIQDSSYSASESYDTSEDAAATTDPTVANAGLTELSAGQAQPMTQTTQINGTHNQTQSSTGEEGANKAATGSSWDSGTAGTEPTQLPLEESFEIVPRDPAETDTPNAGAPTSTGLGNAAAETGAGLNQSSSWADDAAEADAGNNVPAKKPAAATDDDGFHEVQGRHHHHRGRGGHGRGDGEGGRGRGRGRGGFRGGDRGDRGERGDHRGRGGFRGEGGRGRGEGRGRGGGGRGAPRGQPSS